MKRNYEDLTYFTPNSNKLDTYGISAIKLKLVDASTGTSLSEASFGGEYHVVWSDDVAYFSPVWNTFPWAQIEFRCDGSHLSIKDVSEGDYERIRGFNYAGPSTLIPNIQVLENYQIKLYNGYVTIVPTTETLLVLNTELSSYATTSALDVVSASVSTMASSIDAMRSSVSTLASSISSKRDYLDLTYSYSSTSTVTQSIFDPLYKTANGTDWEYNYGDENHNPWGITAMTITFPSEFVSYMEQGLEEIGSPLPEGYSALPSTYDLEYILDENLGEYRWMPTG